MSEPGGDAMRGKYVVSNPVSHAAFVPGPVEEKPLLPTREHFQGLQAPIPEIKLAPKATGETQAVWVVHGMGQQMPFETLDQLAEGLIAGALRAGAKLVEPIQACEVKIGDYDCERVELTFEAEGKPRKVHLYECYWAPLTEGQVKLQDVVSFLLSSAAQKLRKSCHFSRMMFGDMQECEVKPGTHQGILTALALMAALGVIFALALSSGAARFFGESVPVKFAPGSYTQLTTLAGAVCFVAVAYGVLMWLAVQWRQSASIKKASSCLLSVSCWGATLVTALMVIGSAMLMVVVAVNLWIPWGLDSPMAPVLPTVGAMCAAALAWRGRHWTRTQVAQGKKEAGGATTEAKSKDCHKALGRCFLFAVFLYVGSLAAMFWCLFVHWPAQNVWPNGWWRDFLSVLSAKWWAWPLLLATWWGTRYFLIQYVGDVAAYITPNQLDRFTELRAKIKQTARNSAQAAYQALASPDQFEYRSVAVVGHSLGSVIAYDTLNALITEDRLTKDPQKGYQLDIVGRTKLLLTFGSPLDKTAYFFTLSSQHSRHIRELLAEVVQPLIEDYEYRKFPWVNIYSENDIISGALKYYDWPEPPDPDPNKPRQADDQTVENVPDPKAVVPLAAHTEYWNNELVWDRLWAELRK